MRKITLHSFVCNFPDSAPNLPVNNHLPLHDYKCPWRELTLTLETASLFYVVDEFFKSANTSIQVFVIIPCYCSFSFA